MPGDGFGHERADSNSPAPVHSTASPGHAVFQPYSLRRRSYVCRTSLAYFDVCVVLLPSAIAASICETGSPPAQLVFLSLPCTLSFLVLAC